MIDWILTNKEWFFSGIGIVIFIYFIKFINWLINRNKHEDQINKIAQRYVDILDHKISGHSGIISLIESGAAQLPKNKHFLKVCDKITEFGKPNPLESWILKYIDKKHTLKFVKWQAKNNITYSPHYFNENNFAKLVQCFKENS